MASRFHALLSVIVGLALTVGVLALWRVIANRSGSSGMASVADTAGPASDELQADTSRVELTAEERAMLPAGYPVDAAERAFGRILAMRLRALAPPAAPDSSDRGMLSEQLIGLRIKSYPSYDLMVLWPRVEARLRGSGVLPPLPPTAPPEPAR